MTRNLLIGTLAIGFALSLSYTNVSAQQGTTGQTGGNTGGFGTGTQGTTGQGTTGQTTGSATGSAAGVTNDFSQQQQTGLRDNLSAADAVFGQNTQEPAGFVGGPGENLTNTFALVEGGTGGASGIGNLIRQLGNLQQGQVSRGRRVIRAPLRLGFTVSKPADSTISERFERRITRLPAFEDLDGVEAVLEDGTLTLTGTVRTSEDRDKLGRVALLEPGVFRVNNQLEFSGEGQ